MKLRVQYDVVIDVEVDDVPEALDEIRTSVQDAKWVSRVLQETIEDDLQIMSGSIEVTMTAK